MTELIFIRHAETDLAGTFCGHSDPPVNTTGEHQLQELIGSLAPLRLQAVISSDLQRASYTAAKIGEAFNIPVTASTQLREISFGDWEGLRWSDVECGDEVQAREWADNFPRVTPPNGEPFDSFQGRVLCAVTSLLERGDHDRLAVVTHGGVMRVVLQDLLQRTAEEAWAITRPYCSWFAYSPADTSQEAAV